MKKFKPFFKKMLTGMVVGGINGFFGAGGGLVLIPLLIGQGMDRKQAHQNAVAIIFGITLTGAVSYIVRGRVDPLQSLVYLPGGLLGALAGTFVMKKISPTLMRRLFGAFMLWAGWRLCFG